jgi:hypothetical protein
LSNRSGGADQIASAEWQAAVDATLAREPPLSVSPTRWDCATASHEAERLAREARDEPKHAIALEIKALTAPPFGEALALGEQAAASYL